VRAASPATGARSWHGLALAHPCHSSLALPQSTERPSHSAAGPQSYSGWGGTAGGGRWGETGAELVADSRLASAGVSASAGGCACPCLAVPRLAPGLVTATGSMAVPQGTRNSGLRRGGWHGPNPATGCLWSLRCVAGGPLGE